VEWTEHDDHVFPEIRAATLRTPRRGSAEWFARRNVIDFWLLEVTGSGGRGNLMVGKRASATPTSRQNLPRPPSPP
jgi:hypothetical protein